MWVGGGAVQFFGKDGDAEVAGLDALDHGELEDLQDLVDGGADVRCVLEMRVTNSQLHQFTSSPAGRPDRAGQMPVRPESW